MAIAVTRKVVAKHHGAIFQGFCKGGVIVEQCLQLLQLFDKTRLVPQLISSQFIEPIQAGTLVAFGKNHVKPEQRNLLTAKQFIGECGQLVARPRPAAQFSQAFFINIDDDDPFIQRFWHGCPQTHVINKVIKLLQHANGRNGDGMQQGQQQRKQRNSDAGPVLQN